MKQYNVTGMSCAACSARVEKAVKAVDGVSACSVSLLTNTMGVEGVATDINDDDKINQRTVNRRIPYENMIYLGDGMTDIPCMVVVRQNHGSAIAISKNNKSDTLKQLIKSGRVNFACTANYK